MNDVSAHADPFDLERFLQAQHGAYEHALAEIREGRKQTHWMWYIFPQIDGLGYSSMSQRYSIKSVEEAEAYLRHPVLGRRLEECCTALVELGELTAREIFGSPDELKLRSCATLFASVAPGGSIFERVLDRFFGGQSDPRTLEILGAMSGNNYDD